MADLRRVRVSWTTGPGGIGLSTFYTFDPDDVTTNLATFYNAIKALFPAAVTWSIPSSGDLIDSATGSLVGGWSGGTAATIAGAPTTGNYAAGTGAITRWDTGTVVAGRRLRGRTFLVPLAVNAYSTTGVIDTTPYATLSSASSTLAATNKLVVWHRPAPGGAGGLGASVGSAFVLPGVHSLASRRV